MDIDKEKRIIKFRAWSKVLKSMTHDLKIHMPDSDVPKFTYLNDVIENYQKLFIFTQYIGAKDRYGREIYEGDVVKWIYPYHDDCLKSDEIYGLVEWDDMECQFKIRQLSEGFYEIGCGSKERLKFYDDKRNFEFKDLQIIGNIYKNPELINIEEKIKEDKIKEEKDKIKKDKIKEEKDKIKEEKRREEEKKSKGTEIRKLTIE